MKHEIDIEGMPDGWEAVEILTDPDQYNKYVGDDGCLYWDAKIKMKKIKPRRIVLEETDSSRNNTIYVKDITIDIYSEKLWKIVDEKENE